MKKLWIDCDPGIDDAVTLLLAFQMDLEILGISAVAGNSTLDYTFANARNLVSFGQSSAKVYPGAKEPLVQPLHTAPHVHGINGLGDAHLPKSLAPVEEKKAWDALYEAVHAYGEDMEIIAMGPLTNIAIALSKYPDLKEKISRLLIMGGSAAYGNVTPAAEFNIFVDPQAAEIVFKNLNVVMFGLDSVDTRYMI